MPYSSNQTINGLDAETTIADTDELIFGDVSDTNRAKKITFANLKTEIVGDDTAFVRKADYDANSILYATSDNTPLALTVGTNSVVGRVGGNITPLAVDSDLSSVSASDDTVPSAKATKTALDLKANDSAVVKLTGDQTVAGVKTFSSDPIIPDEAYGSGWNGVLEPPTKNAVYDKIESLFVGTFTNGVSTHDASATGAETIAHGLGKTPKKIRIKAVRSAGSGTLGTVSEGTYNGTTNSALYFTTGESGNPDFWINGTSATQIVYLDFKSSQTNTAIATFDGTNITLTWSKGGSPTGTVYLLWEAEG